MTLKSPSKRHPRFTQKRQLKVMERALEILETDGWAQASMEKFKGYYQGQPLYSYCALGAISKAVSEEFGVPFQQLLNPSPDASREELDNRYTVYSWNDSLIPEVGYVYNNRVPREVVRVFRKVIRELQ